jgi:hypothetical protein
LYPEYGLRCGGDVLHFFGADEAGGDEGFVDIGRKGGGYFLGSLLVWDRECEAVGYVF